MNTFQEIQENIFDYFKDTEDSVLIKFINCFVYNNSTTETEISKMIEKFLEDNGLVAVFCNYQLDLTEPQSFFRRTTMSQAGMIDQIKQSLLSIAFNRFKTHLESCQT